MRFSEQGTHHNCSIQRQTETRFCGVEVWRFLLRLYFSALSRSSFKSLDLPQRKRFKGEIKMSTKNNSDKKINDKKVYIRKRNKYIALSFEEFNRRKENTYLYQNNFVKRKKEKCHFSKKILIASALKVCSICSMP